jgi:hypothetical protein
MLRGKAADGVAYLRQRGEEARDAAEEAVREGTLRATRGTKAVKAAMEAGKQAYSESIQS